MEVVVTTGAIRRPKLQSTHHRQRTNAQLFTGRMPFLRPNQQSQNIEGKNLPMDLCSGRTCRQWNRAATWQQSAPIQWLLDCRLILF